MVTFLRQVEYPPNVLLNGLKNSKSENHTVPLPALICSDTTRFLALHSAKRLPISPAHDGSESPVLGPFCRQSYIRQEIRFGETERGNREQLPESGGLTTCQNPSFVLRAIKDVAFEDRPIPKLRDEYEVRVQVAQTGICGSDVCLVHARY